MGNSRIAFVIMQIGNVELDKLYLEILAPAIKDANLEPKRIDIDNTGKLLKQEITDYIQRAEIIVADLTNERPNCYLEVGYAMGLDKYNNLIFTCREDHLPTSKNYSGGAKLHFDVSGYDVLLWDSSELIEFKSKLTEKISRRLSIISTPSTVTEQPLWDEKWLDQQRSHIWKNISEMKFARYFEALTSPLDSSLNMHQNELLENSINSQIQASGWPIGLVINQGDLKPIPKTDGIVSEIKGTVINNSYDYTYYKKNGQIYLAKTLLEERNYQNSIVPEARIRRMTELLLFISRYYLKCGLPKNSRIKITIRFVGLLNNSLNFANRGVPSVHSRISKENEALCEVITSITDIEARLPELVMDILKDLFILFNFYMPDLNFVKTTVNNFVAETNTNRA